MRGKSVAATTHFHADHVADIYNIIKHYRKILLHPVTYNALVALDPALRLRTRQFVPTGYGVPFSGDDYTASLLASNHIPGSCQVLVEHDGKRLLYSGDFNYPDVHTPKCDYLVLDATHGDPRYDYERVDREFITQRMCETIVEKTDDSKSVVVRSSRGTLQEIIGEMETRHRRVRDDVVFVADKGEIDVLAAIYDTGAEGGIRKIVRRDSVEAHEAMSGGATCVMFASSLQYDADADGWFAVYVDRYRFSKETPGIIDTGNGIRCNLSAYANYPDIIRFIRDVDPQFVLVDSSRSRCAATLAERIREELGIDAEAS